MSSHEALRQARFILDSLHVKDEIVHAAYEIKDYLIDLVLDDFLEEMDFYNITSAFSPQSRSPLWEKYFIQKHSCRPVNRNEDRGDLEKDGRYYEYKASGFNRDNALHIVQIRLWQNCDYIVQSISNYDVITFVLTHNQMTQESIRCKASSAHGTKSVTALNERNELRMTLLIDSDHWNRWVTEYKNLEPFG